MKRSALALAAALALLPLSALAHKAWIMPSETVVSGANPTITVDAAVSNDLFYFNHQPLRGDIVVTAPDGSIVPAANAATGKLRSTFDVELAQQGTYRIGSASADGNRRIETYVTNGNPTRTVLVPSNKGLELVPDAAVHPNDLFAGEKSGFVLLLDGKPSAGTTVTVIPGGSRYRNAQDEQVLKTDAKGHVEINWPTAGMYGLQASVGPARGEGGPGGAGGKPAGEGKPPQGAPAAQQGQPPQGAAPGEGGRRPMPNDGIRRASYVVTLEVLPQ